MIRASIPDLELTLAAKGPGTYRLDLRFLPPNADTTNLYESRRPLTFDVETLTLHTAGDTSYGDLLGQSLLADPEALAFFEQARAVAHNAGLPLRTRLAIRSNAAQLQQLHWERLRIPGEAGFVARDERVLFSRYLSTTDGRPVRPRRRADIRALAVVANPSDLDAYGLAPIAVEDEIARAKSGFGEITVQTLATRNRATMDAMTDRLRDGYDVLYLVCHGTLDSGTPWLWLEQADGSVDHVDGSEFVTRIAGLQTPPRLVILASCRSAGDGSAAMIGEDGVLAALGPRLAEGGVPAVIAMQGNVLMETMASFTPTLLRELRRDGQIDRAVAAARWAVHQSTAWWVPVLYMNSQSGRLFVDDDDEESTSRQVRTVTAGEGGIAIGGDVHGDISITNVAGERKEDIAARKKLHQAKLAAYRKRVREQTGYLRLRGIPIRNAENLRIPLSSVYIDRLSCPSICR